jgi:hypothetical protein
VNLPRAFSNKYAIWTGFLLLPHAAAWALDPSNGAVAASLLAPVAPLLNFFADGAYAY